MGSDESMQPERTLRVRVFAPPCIGRAFGISLV